MDLWNKLFGFNCMSHTIHCDDEPVADGEYQVIAYNYRDDEKRTIFCPSRVEALIYLACFTRLDFYDSIEGCVKRALEILADMKRNEYGQMEYRGLAFMLDFGNSGDFSLELNPGVGTTACRMILSDAKSAYSVLYGLLECRRTDFFLMGEVR